MKEGREECRRWEQGRKKNGEGERIGKEMGESNK